MQNRILRPTPQDKRHAPRDERINLPTHKSRITIPDDNDNETIPIKQMAMRTTPQRDNIMSKQHMPPPYARHGGEQHETQGREDHTRRQARRNDETQRHKRPGTRRHTRRHEQDALRDDRIKTLDETTPPPRRAKSAKRTTRTENAPTDAKAQGELTKSKLNRRRASRSRNLPTRHHSHRRPHHRTTQEASVASRTTATRI